jgi:RNA-directed DNA polymerase
MSESSPGSLTRQQLYDRIRETSKDEYILSEMIRLGYWNENEEKPSLTADFIERKGKLEKELRELVKKQQFYSDPEKALLAVHKQRKAEALLRREETKKKNNEERFQKKVRWHEKNQQTITHLGDYSAGLEGSFTDRERLQNQALPLIKNSLALSEAMGVSINELRFLSYGRKTSQVSHYKQFLIAKKRGGTRRISTPMPRLKRLQYWILENILGKISLHDSVHGFVPERSIVTNAEPHVGKEVVVNMDLRNFFPTISYKRIKGLFCNLGYSEQVATILALLCSEPEVDEVMLDNQRFYVARSERFLPQGAPTSPAISNIICRKLDRRMFGAAEKLGFTYTRYADDLTFSGSKINAHRLGKLLWRVEQIIESEDFQVHPNKTRIMRSNHRQEVTGIIVNEKLSICRKTLRKFRALLFQIEKDGPEGKSWGPGELIPSIEGYANFVAMVNPEKGIGLQKRIVELKHQLGYQVKPGKMSSLNNKLMRLSAAQGEAPSADWWMAGPPPAPTREPTPKEIEEDKKAKRKAAQQRTQQEDPDELFETAPPSPDKSGNLLWLIFAVIVGSIWLLTR